MNGFVDYMGLSGPRDVKPGSRYIQIMVRGAF